jgi:hypothetical protein
MHEEDGKVMGFCRVVKGDRTNRYDVPPQRSQWVDPEVITLRDEIRGLNLTIEALRSEASQEKIRHASNQNKEAAEREKAAHRGAIESFNRDYARERSMRLRAETRHDEVRRQAQEREVALMRDRRELYGALSRYVDPVTLFPELAEEIEGEVPEVGDSGDAGPAPSPVSIADPYGKLMADLKGVDYRGYLEGPCRPPREPRSWGRSKENARRKKAVVMHAKVAAARALDDLQRIQLSIPDEDPEPSMMFRGKGSRIREAAGILCKFADLIDPLDEA